MSADVAAQAMQAEMDRRIAVAAAVAASAAASELRSNAQEQAWSGSSLSTALPFDGDASAYPGWAMQMKALLMQRGLWDSVSTQPLGGAGKPQARSVLDDSDDNVCDGDELASSASAGPGQLAGANKKAQQAYTILLMNMKDRDVLASLIDVPEGNAHEVWKRLQERYSRNTPAYRHALKKEFRDLQMARGEAVAAFATRMKKCVLALAAVSEKPSASDITFTFTNGLHDGFSHMRQALLISDTNGTKTFEELISLALVVETQFPASDRGGVRQEQAHFAGGGASKHGAGRGGAGGSGGGARGACWRCGKTGHNKMACTMDYEQAIVRILQPQGPRGECVSPEEWIDAGRLEQQDRGRSRPPHRHEGGRRHVCHRIHRCQREGEGGIRVPDHHLPDRRAGD